MPFSSGIGNTIARLPVPKSIQKAFLATSREGMSAILPLEASVIIGRTASETARSGFLGFQERLPEESAAAFIWLCGVRLLQLLFDKIKAMLFPKGKHLSGEVAWNRPWQKRTSVDLTAQELFTKNAQEMGKLTQTKSLRWLFSVGLALAGVAYIVPKLNQWKTNWVLKHFYEGKGLEPNTGEITPSGVGRPTSTSVLAGVPGMAPNTLQSSAAPANFTATPFVFQNFKQNFQNNSLSARVSSTNQSFNNALGAVTLDPNRGPITPSGVGRPTPIVPAGVSPTTPRFGQSFDTPAPSIPTLTNTPNSLFVNGSRSNFNQGFNPTTNQSTQPQFGLLSGGLLQGLGYAVEHTVYGNILVVDTGIVAGRVTASRNQYEAFEVAFRDVASLYFYILCAPHMMKLFSKALDPAFQTHIMLQPKVAEAMTRVISDGLAARTQDWLAHEKDPVKRAAIQSAFERGVVSKDFVLEMIRGSSNPALLKPSTNLNAALRTATLDGPSGFLSLFEKEMTAYGWPQEQAGEVLKAIREKTTSGAWTTAGLDQLLTAVEGGQGAFASLTTAQKKELTVSLKNAYRHSAGVAVDLSKAVPMLNGKALNQAEGFADVWSQWSEHEQSSVMQRLRRLAEIDNLDQVRTMLRRSLNLFREPLGEKPALTSQLETLTDWVDKAVGQQLTLSELLEKELSALRAPLEKQGLLAPQEVITPEKLRHAAQALNGRSGLAVRKLSQQLTALNDLLPNAVSNHPLGVQVREHISATFDDLFAQTKLDTRLTPILEQYRQLIQERLQEGRGQLFSLSINEGDTALDAKLKALLTGGLQHDSAFLKKAQDIVGEAVIDPRKFNNPVKAQRLRTSVVQYGEKLVNRLEQETVQDVQGLPKLIQWGNAAETFQKLNQNLNYGARLVSMAGAIVGLSFVVPKIQYAITRTLTGKNENPGIASAERAILAQRGNMPAG